MLQGDTRDLLMILNIDSVCCREYVTMWEMYLGRKTLLLSQQLDSILVSLSRIDKRLFM